MSFYLLGSEENYNEIRFTNVQDHQEISDYNNFKGIANYPLEYVYGIKSKKNKNFDFSQICNPFFIVSKNALIYLEEILLEYGELIPIEKPFDNFMFFHCTNIVNALIPEKSKIVWLDKEKGWISGINSFTLDKKNIGNSEIFRLPEANYRYTFFGEKFKALIEANNLKGIDFDRFEKIEII